MHAASEPAAEHRLCLLCCTPAETCITDRTADYSRLSGLLPDMQGSERDNNCWDTLNHAGMLQCITITTQFGSARSFTHLLTFSTWVHKFPNGWPTRSAALKPKLSAVLLSAHRMMPVPVVQNLAMFWSWLLAGRERRITPINRASEPLVFKRVTYKSMGKVERFCKGIVLPVYVLTSICGRSGQQGLSSTKGLNKRQ